MNTIQSANSAPAYPQPAAPANAAATTSTAPAAQAPAAATHTVAPPGTGTQAATTSAPQHMMGYLSPAYFMAAMQMMPTQNLFSGMMPFSGVAAQSMPSAPMHAAIPTASGSGTEAGGHVTANTTNSLAATQSPMVGSMMPAGISPMQRISPMQGMGGAMAMPVGFVFAQPMMLSPVLFGVLFGFAAMPGMNAEPVASQPAQPRSANPEVVPAPPGTQEPVAEVPVEEDIPVKPPVIEVGAEEFRKLRTRSSRLETSLQLSLTTRDGDLVSLDFSQVDLMERSRSPGKSEEDSGQRHRGVTQSHDRAVNMRVEGDLDEGERAAIDAVLAEVIDLANRFFTGNMDGLMQRLQSFDLDTEALAEFSLQMNMTRSVSFSRVHQHGRGSEIQNLASRDGEVMKMLEFLATEQRTLIRSASEVLDAPSAVKLVRGLLPPLLNDPFARLAQALDEAEVPEEVPSVEAEPVAGQSPEEESSQA